LTYTKRLSYSASHQAVYKRKTTLDNGAFEIPEEMLLRRFLLGSLFENPGPMSLGSLSPHLHLRALPPGNIRQKGFLGSASLKEKSVKSEITLELVIHGVGVFRRDPSGFICPSPNTSDITPMA
jgi:hypothetical protein